MVDDASGDREGNAGDEEPVSDPDTPADGDARWGSAPRSERTDATDRSDSPSDVGDRERAEPADSDSGSDGTRIPLDLSGGSDRDESGGSDEADSDDRDADADDPYAPEPSSAPIEAGDPELENAVFVLLGVVAMILVLVRIASLPL